MTRTLSFKLGQKKYFNTFRFFVNFRFISEKKYLSKFYTKFGLGYLYANLNFIMNFIMMNILRQEQMLFQNIFIKRL